MVTKLLITNSWLLKNMCSMLIIAFNLQQSNNVKIKIETYNKLIWTSNRW